MSPEIDYNKIKSIVKKLMRECGAHLIEAEDVISESYIKFIETKEPYTLNSFIKLCRGQIFRGKNTFEKTYDGVTAPRHRYKGSDHKTCKDCTSVLPVQAFRDITFHKANGIIVKSPYCRRCQNKRSRINRKGHSDRVSDWFVITTVLARKNNRYSKEFIISRPRLIEIERNLILRKRKRRRAA
jgi:hypothetical protein